jgi:peptidoglycan/xylan/chitin deacetylase (PgdA/CDA1 family)
MAIPIGLFKRIFKGLQQFKFVTLALSTLVPALAGPITTTPWNGHTGAVSFTYDDARTSQIPNLLPQLDALKIKATFFICLTGAGGDFEARKADWITAARSGHELANHTKAHVSMPADPAAGPIIVEMAKYLRDLDPAVESVTFAYPGCGVNGKTGVGSENFVSRGCGQVNYSWGTQPSDWMNIQGLILNPSNVATAITMLNSAKSSNSWVTTIVHDVKESPDQYSLTPADNKKMLEAGLANNLWVDTYQNIAAYYRAHFAMDAAIASATNAGWNVTWTSPNPKMPKSVKLRVKLASATFGNSITVQQNNTTIPPETDGSFIIDFMSLSLNVIQGTTGIKSKTILPSQVNAELTQNGIRYYGVFGDVEATVSDFKGKVLFQRSLSKSFVPLSKEQRQGILFLTLKNPQTRTSVHTLINAVQ